MESKTSQYIALGLVLALVAVIWYFISWRPYFAKSEEEEQVRTSSADRRPKTLCGSTRLRESWKRLKQRAEVAVAEYLDSNITDYAKILISFFQASLS